MHLIITRHGQTLDNIKRICQGQLPGELSPEGIAQAKKLALRLKDRKIDAIYSSDLKRAADTAKEVMMYHPELTLQLDERLRERKFGSMEGKPFPEHIDWNNLPEDVENNEAMHARVKNFLDEIYEKHKNQTVLFVCHGGLTLMFLTLLHNKPLSAMGTWEPIKNTSVSEFDIREDGNHHIYFVACGKHLL